MTNPALHPDTLPIDGFLDEALSLLKKHQNLVVVAAPGAGKTTRLPAFLARALTRKVLVLEPRRMAAIAAAHRVAEEQGWELGREVGYQVRFANMSSKETQLVFLTEALLARKLASDPELAGVECVVLDEFHERSLHVDLALGLLKELQELGRDIKLVVMSATLDSQKISKFLGSTSAETNGAEAPAAPVLDVPGKLYPLEIQYQKNSQLLQITPKFYEQLLSQIREAEKATDKDILVFLPGVGEIERSLGLLEEWAHTRDIFLVPLHGSLPLEAQRKALQKASRRRIVLATNIAESSVTVDGVGCVIDSGLSRSMRFDARTGFSRLELGRISRSSSQQRAGRAARQFPGVCYRLWNKLDEASMPAQDVAEILRSELSESVLFLAAQGVTNFSQFSWYERPHDVALANASASLQGLGALTNTNAMTPLGRRMLSLPLPPRLSKLMLIAAEEKLAALGADIASILLERDFLPKQSAAHFLGDQFENDILLRLHLLSQFRENQAPRNLHRQTLSTIEQSARQILKLIKESAPADVGAIDPARVNRLLLLAFADRLCRRRSAQSERALMVGGRGVKISAESIVVKSEFLLALNGIETQQSSETVVSVAAGLEKSFLMRELQNSLEKVQSLSFDREKGQFYLRTNKVFRDLVIEEGSVSIASAKDVAEHLPGVLAAEWEWVLKENEALQKFISRLSYFVRRRDLIKDKTVAEALETFAGEELFSVEQRTLAFSHAASGEKDFYVVARKNLVPYFEAILDPKVLTHFQEATPAKIQVPSGSWIEVQYVEERDPYIEVRIQEVFGWKEAPKLMNGHQSLTLSLLGPNYRPMQITNNLTSFWQTGYAEVRKELRLRYPKHSWPEDPLTAIAVAKGRSTKF